MTMDSASCPGKVCRFRSECPFALARQKVLDAGVVIANHDQLLSDLQLGDGIILPRIDESVVVIDEAHALPLTATSHFGNRVALKNVFSALEDVAPIASRFDSLSGSGIRPYSCSFSTCPGIRRLKNVPAIRISWQSFFYVRAL